RFASALDGLCRGSSRTRSWPRSPAGTWRTGSTGTDRQPEHFMGTFFHHPDELRAEVIEAGFVTAGVYGVEGPCWLLADFDAWWENGEYRGRLSQVACPPGISARLVGAATRWRVRAWLYQLPNPFSGSSSLPLITMIFVQYSLTLACS